MATLSLEQAQLATPGYWLFDRRSDLGWFGVSLFVPILLYLPLYWAFGSSVVWPLYLVYVAGFATPHLWLTWAVMLPPGARGLYSKQSLWLPLSLTAAAVVAVPLTARFGGWDLFFTGVTMLGVYHIYKQHLGMLRIYDAKYAQTYGEKSIFADLKPLHDFCALAFALPVFWVWTSPPFDVVVGIQRFSLIYPQIPVWALIPYGLAMAYFLLCAGRNLERRHRAGLPLPSAHLSLALSAGLSYLIAFGLVPPKDFLLTLAIFITYHDLQYGGFVWNFHRKRSEALAAEGKPLDALHRWALKGKALPYFGVAYLFSVLVVGAIAVSVPMVAIGVVVFVNVIHYLMDGMVWRRDHYPRLHEHLGLGR